MIRLVWLQIIGNIHIYTYIHTNVFEPTANIHMNLVAAWSDAGKQIRGVASFHRKDSLEMLYINSYPLQHVSPCCKFTTLSSMTLYCLCGNTSWIKFRHDNLSPVLPWFYVHQKMLALLAATSSNMFNPNVCCNCIHDFSIRIAGEPQV